MEETIISVRLEDSEGEVITDAEIIIDGYGVSDSVFTDEHGEAVLTIRPLYGERISVRALSSEGIIIATKQIKVFNADRFSPYVSSVYVTEIEMEDSLAKGFEGSVSISSDVSDFQFYSYLGSSMSMTFDVDGDSFDFSFTPS